MNPPPSWSSETPPQTGRSDRTAGSAAAAKDWLPAAPISGWEAAMSESIHVGGKLEGEGAALAAIKDHRSILYLAGVRGCMCARRSRRIFLYWCHESDQVYRSLSK